MVHEGLLKNLSTCKPVSIHIQVYKLTLYIYIYIICIYIYIYIFECLFLQYFKKSSKKDVVFSYFTLLIYNLYRIKCKMV